MARTNLHEALRTKTPVRLASTANITLSTPGATIDGVSVVNGDRILLKNQTTGSQNGIYVWSGASTTLTRALDASAASDFVLGFKVYVSEGTANGGKYWTYTTSAAVTLGTTTLTFVQDGAGTGTVTSIALTMPSDFLVSGSPITSSGTLAVTANTQSANTIKAGPTTGASAAPTYRTLVSADLPTAPTVTGEMTASDFKPSGLTGATAATRWVGATASGAPVSGTFVLGDFITDQTGKLWLCTTGGSPGTWAQVSGSGAGGAATTVSNSLSGDVTISSANTYFDGPTVSLTAGTWLLTGEVTGVNSSTGTNFTARLWDGTTTVDSTSAANNGSGAASTLSLHGIVTPSVTTSYKISVAATATSSTVKAAAPFNAVGNNASTLVAIPLISPQSVYSQSSTAPATATAGTITTSGVSAARVSPAGAITGVILQAGTFGGQEVAVVNEAIAANTVTFAASGTSNVANGTASVIAGLTARKFVWDTSTTLWYPCV